jgi:hypothetical protein
MRSASSPEPRSDFNTQDDFLAFAKNKIQYSTRFHFTNANGSEEWISLDDACEAARRIKLFLSAPEKISSMTLHDGRMIVAAHNHASLTQHLRWAAGLDADSKPKPKPEGYVHPPLKWPETALLWFWSNGGKAWDGRPGTYHEWQKKVNAEPAPGSLMVPQARTMPQISAGELEEDAA